MNARNRYFTTPLTAAIAAALYPGHSAQAQEQEQETDRVLEEVIVTATKRAVSMQDLPQSIQAFTNEDIIRNAFTDFQGVANAIPSLTLIQDMPGRNSIKFRGVSTGTGEYYTDSTAAIYLDETPLTFQSQQLWPALVDIERIESLPGPQGTIFGSSSLAGTVRIITNKPDPSGWSGEAFGEYYATKGGAGSWSVNGHVNIPLIEDTLALRLVAHARKDGGWVDNIFGEPFVVPDQSRFSAPVDNSGFVENDWNEFRLTGGRAALLWNVNEDWQTVLTFMSEKNEADGNWGEDQFFRDNQTALFHDEFRDDEWWNASLEITGDLGFADVVSSTTYLDRDITYEWENMVYEQYKDSWYGHGQWLAYYYPAYAAYAAYYAYPLYNSEYTFGWIFNDQTQDRFSQEIRLTSKGDSRFQWMVGGFYEEINDFWLYGAKNPDLTLTDQPGEQWYYASYWAYYYNYYGYDVAYPLPLTDISYSFRLDRTVKQLAFFGEVSYDLTDRVNLTAGARWFEFKRDELDQNMFPEGLPVWGTFDTRGIFTSDSKDNDVTYKISLSYNFSDDKMMYVLYSQGFRLGGNNSQRAVATGLIPETYDPDFLNNYELGFKTEWLDNSLQANLTFFLLDWEERQFSEDGAGLPWWLRGNINAGDTETKGVEFSGNWQVNPDFRLEATVTWMEAEAKSTYVFLSGLTLSPGDDLPNAPELSYYLAADYTFPWRPFDGDLWARVSYAYGDEWWESTSAAINHDPDGLVPDWNNTNLQVGLSLPNDWTITAFVNNLTDEERINAIQDNGYAADLFGTPFYRIIHYTQRPRSYGINVRKRFN